MTADHILTTAAIGSPLWHLRVLLDLAESYRVASRGREADTAFAKALPQLIALGYERTETAETLFNNWALVVAELGRPAMRRCCIGGRWPSGLRQGRGDQEPGSHARPRSTVAR